MDWIRAECRSTQNLGFPRRLLLDRVLELLDHGVAENFFRHPFHFGLRGRLVKPAIQRDLEILALAHVAHAFVTHLVERAVDGLALRIEDSLLQRDVNVGFHGWIDYKSRAALWTSVSSVVRTTAGIALATASSARGSLELR